MHLSSTTSEHLPPTAAKGSPRTQGQRTDQNRKPKASVPIGVELKNSLNTMDDLSELMLAVIILARLKCIPVMRENGVMGKGKKTNARAVLNELKQIEELNLRRKDGDATPEELVSFLHDLKTDHARRAVVPVFLRDLAETMKRLADRKPDCAFMANKIYLTEGDAYLISTEMDSAKLADRTDPAYVLERLNLSFTPRKD